MTDAAKAAADRMGEPTWNLGSRLHIAKRRAIEDNLPCESIACSGGTVFVATADVKQEEQAPEHGMVPSRGGADGDY